MKASCELSGDQSPVLMFPDAANLTLLAPSMSETQSSVWFGPRTLMYITRLPSAEMMGCEAFSETISTDSLLRTR